MTHEPAQNAPETIRPAEALALLRRGEARLIDVREPDEFAAEHIDGARNLPLSRFDPASLAASGATPTIFHCKSGRRSREALTRAAAAGHTAARSLEGGIDAWKSSGFPTIALARAPIAIMRQVQIVVGAAVLAGSIAAWLISPWFLAVTGFFGAGLLFAGLSGTCALAAVLGVMPWNRALRAPAPTAACPIS